MLKRDLLKSFAALMLSSLPPIRAYGAVSDVEGFAQPLVKAQPFDYAWLKGHARTLAAQPYREVPSALPKAIKDLNWDEYQAISYRADHALWAGLRTRFHAKFFHLGLYYQKPVRMYEVGDGKAREIAYDQRMFDYGKSRLQGAQLPANLGFAGFRLNFHTDWVRDVAAFLGASYFRAVGGELQYGLSARGLAIDCGMSRAEEFPMFTEFWLERPAGNSDTLTVYALLDSPSTTGAYRFDIRPAATLTMDIDAAIYPRKAIERIGIAPLTSMYLHGENDRRMANDWRPELHDSDGLAMWSGNGEWIWRPLTNPPAITYNAYSDDNPRGFGLLQRDRNFTITRMTGCFTKGVPACGWSQNPAGARVRSISLSCRLSMKRRTTSSRSGIRRHRHKPARNCCSVTACIGERTCRRIRRSQPWSRHAPGLAAWSDVRAHMWRGASPWILPGAISPCWAKTRAWSR